MKIHPISLQSPTNKGILPKGLMDEMREAFKRSEEFLDLEKSEYNPVEKTKEQVKSYIERLSPEQLQRCKCLSGVWQAAML